MSDPSPPIIVLADDLSGAAEIAGAATRLGLSAEVRTQWFESTSTDVICIDTNTRALENKLVQSRMMEWLDHLDQPLILFKKTDSLLRGHVLTEINTIVQHQRLEGALLCPVNPSKMRTILDGNYWIDGELLHESIHRLDPQFPRTTSSVRDLLGEPSHHIQLPDVRSINDLEILARQIDQPILPAGGVDFFQAWLPNVRTLSSTVVSPLPYSVGRLPIPAMMVCGSQTAWYSGREAQAKEHGIPIRLLDDNFETDVELPYLLAVGLQTQPLPVDLEFRLALDVKQRLSDQHPRTLLIEGGATARSIVDALGCHRFTCLGEVGAGCVALKPMEANMPICVLKPGSYRWPETLWNFVRESSARSNSQ